MSFNSKKLVVDSIYVGNDYIYEGDCSVVEGDH